MIKQAALDHWLNLFFSWACLPLVLGAAFALSNITWLVFAPSALEPVRLLKNVSVKSMPADAMVNSLDIPKVTSWQLFGTFQAAPSAVVAAPQADAPDTSLSLELAGVFVAINPKKSTAVILEKGREAQLYGINDQLPGNAQLNYVYDDRVVIKRNGRFETLRFPRDPSAEQGISMTELPPSSVSTKSGTKPAGGVPAIKRILDQSQKLTPEKLVQSLQSSLQSGASATIDQLGLEAVDGGAEKGYRVTGRTPPHLMNMLGLKQGDILLTVNGTPIGDITKDQSLFNQVVASGQATVTVQSGDRTISATIPIPKGMMR
jgi:general secretion pathway protein C